MGQFYQVRETQLDRDVALKVLPEALTADPDRLGRFEREAKVLASLNHPQESRPLKCLVVLALLGTIGCQAPEDTSETGGDNREKVLADIPICLQDDYLEDAPRDVAIRDHENHSGSLAPFWPSPHEVVDCMLNLADVEENDVVIDLGSGDGRIVIAAAKRGARGIGIDYNPLRIAQANANAEISGVQDLVSFIEGDIRDADLSEATVVTLYLLSASNLELLPKLTEELRPGARIVSHDFNMGSWTPDRTVRLRPHTIYLWHHDGTVRPAEEAGANETQPQ